MSSIQPVEVRRIEWQSPNGVYRIVARKFHDGSCNTYCRKKVKGKMEHLRYRDFPNYILERYREMTIEIEEEIN